MDGGMDTPEQKAALFREEERIGRRRGDWWPETPHGTTEEYIAFLRRVPTGAGLVGLMRQLISESRSSPSNQQITAEGSDGHPQ